MPKVNQNIVISPVDKNKRVYIEKYSRTGLQKSFSFDPNEPCQIAGACVQAKLTTKEVSSLFLYLATTEPYPAWALQDEVNSTQYLKS